MRHSRLHMVHSMRTRFILICCVIHRLLRLDVLLSAACFATAAGPTLATEADQKQRPNILLIVSDDQRPDTVHSLGNSLIETPSLDRLVRDGSVFDRATCGNPICTPSRAEILTGCNGFRMKVRDFGGQISADVPRMAARFRDAGYATWYVGKWHNDGRPQDHGYMSTRGLFTGGGGRFATPQVDYAGRTVTGYKGWVFRDDDGMLHAERGIGLTPEISRNFADAAVDVIDLSVRGLQESSGHPFFLHVNFTSPHDPLMLPLAWEDRYSESAMMLPQNFLPEHPFDHGNFNGRDEQLFRWPRTPTETRQEIAAYYAVISYMDQQIGRILACLKQHRLADNTIVIFTSDHGLALGSHGLRGKQNMYEHTIGTPLIMAGPGIPSGRRFSTQCYLRDLFPTLCDLAGVEISRASIDGISLKPVLDGRTTQVHDFIVGYFRDSQRMIRTVDWKYVEYPEAERHQLFHLATDPLEKNDLSDLPEHLEQQRKLKKQMIDWFRRAGDPVYVR